MKTLILSLALGWMLGQAVAQAPALYIHLVSHNEPSDNLQTLLFYQKAKSNALQLAGIVDSKQARWNLQSSDGFVLGARLDEKNTGTNVFETLAQAPYADNIEIDPRSKNLNGRNIADQWYLLDSLGANPTHTVGGFIYDVCPPADSTMIDWWQYTDTLTGLVHQNKVKFGLLSGAGSLEPHCNDLNDFGIFKPDTTTRFYTHNPARNLWCMGTGCAPLLDSMTNEQAVIDLIQGQVDSIQRGLWPGNKFYVTRIMTNQREYGPMFFQKVARVIDSLNLLPATHLKWATISETFTAFEAWQKATGQDYSQWRCGQTTNAVATPADAFSVSPNPSAGVFTLTSAQAQPVAVRVFTLQGTCVYTATLAGSAPLDLSHLPDGLYYLRMGEAFACRLVKQ